MSKTTWGQSESARQAAIGKAADTITPLIRERMKDLAGTATQERIDQAINQGGNPSDEWLKELDAIWIKAINFGLASKVSALIVARGQSALSGIAAAARKMVLKGSTYNATNKRINEWIAREMGRLVVEVTEEQRRAVRRALQVIGQDETWNVTMIHNAIRASIGLTSRETEWVKNYADSMLDGGDKPALAMKKITRYAEYLRTLRAERIARTEAGRAYTEAEMSAFDQAIGEGIITGAGKRWRTVGDDRVRDEHADMEGEEVGIDEPFSNGENYPGENSINCRCWIEWVLEKGEG